MRITITITTNENGENYHLLEELTGYEYLDNMERRSYNHYIVLYSGLVYYVERSSFLTRENFLDKEGVFKSIERIRGEKWRSENIKQSKLEFLTDVLRKITFYEREIKIKSILL